MELDSDQLNTRWVKKEPILEGTYGIVYKGIDTLNNESIAIKRIKTPLDEDGIPIETLREVVILRNMNHPNIVK
jgi:serine/threonine protein kinase